MEADIHPSTKNNLDSTQSQSSDANTSNDERVVPFQSAVTKPAMPSFSLGGSIASILSLMFMSAVSMVMLLQLMNPENNLIANLQIQLGDGFLGNVLNYLRPPDASAALAAWTWVPFLFTFFGATLGWVFELALVLAATPFQQTKSPFTRFIQKIRFLNLAPVSTSIFFFVCTMIIPDPGLRMAMMCLSGALCVGLGFALFFGGGGATIAMTLMGAQLVQFIMVLAAGIPLGGVFLLLQAILQLGAFLLGTATPMRSFGFHVTSTISAVMLYGAILQVTGTNANFSHEVEILLVAGSLFKWVFIASCIAGLILVIKQLPLSYGNFRVVMSRTIWTPLYFLLVSGPRFPDPFNLSVVFKNQKPIRTRLKPYYQVHPAYMVEKLSIPAVGVDNIERSVTMFTDLVDKAKKLFKLIQWLDHTAPQADISIPIKDKVRMEPWSDGSEYWPRLFARKIFGLTIPPSGQYLEKTPEPLLAAYKEGQLLAYLSEYGIANPLLESAPDQGEGVLKLDFRFLEDYEVKPDYESYGGVAYFKVNAEKQRLELLSVMGPKSEQGIMANPFDPAFRYAEGLILASVYYQVITGKHLAEIHMTYNLVEVCMHNAFDVQGQWQHPFRTFMYLHFFSHEMAEEITTEHLVQEGGIFSQMFATTHAGLVQHLNASYSNFEYGKDEDFDARAAAMMMPAHNGEAAKVLPKSCIHWEVQYFDIWHKYTTSLIDVIYENDDAVANDSYVQSFHTGLLELMLKGLPARYEGFKTKKGLARYAADTIHHTVIRHQVYGTTGIKAALDPRVTMVQVPKDTGTYPVNEWRSLAYVALATGHSRFTLLAGNTGKDFSYLLDGVEESLRGPMAKVFAQLQIDLRDLDAVWTADDDAKAFNYDYFRAIPSDLHTGPGY